MRLPASIGCARASQIVELAVATPLLVLFVVGIYDFGQAFNTKEKLNFAAKDGARLGATQPTNDLSQPVQFLQSVIAIRDLVNADLIAAGIGNCGLAIQPAGSLVWSATGTCPNGSTLTVTINRGFVVPPSGTTPIQQISTRVDIQYPYQWRLGGIVRLVGGGAGFPGATVIDTDGIAANQD